MTKKGRSAHDVREIAVASGSDPRTVRKVLDGKTVLPLVQRRILDAAEKIGTERPDAGGGHGSVASMILEDAVVEALRSPSGAAAIAAAVAPAIARALRAALLEAGIADQSHRDINADLRRAQYIARRLEEETGA